MLAAVITIRTCVGMGSGTVGGRVGGAGGRPAIVAAIRVVGASVIGPSPPIMCGVIAVSCARAGGNYGGGVLSGGVASGGGGFSGGGGTSG